MFPRRFQRSGFEQQLAYHRESLRPSNGTKKILIAISSCQQYENSGLNQTLRDTWLPEAIKLGIDYKFFHGKGAVPKDDVIVLPVDDGMGGLTEKLKEKAKWSYRNGYDYLFSCFPDTYVRPERLLTCGFEKFDYYGRMHSHPDSAPYCQGGPGYFLSRKACEIMFEAKILYLNDDCWLGDVLFNTDIRKGNNKAFAYVGPSPLKSNNVITNHLSTQPGGFTLNSVKDEQKKWSDSWL